MKNHYLISIGVFAVATAGYADVVPTDLSAVLNTKPVAVQAQTPENADVLFAFDYATGGQAFAFANIPVQRNFLDVPNLDLALSLGARSSDSPIPATALGLNYSFSSTKASALSLSIGANLIFPQQSKVAFGFGVRLTVSK